jgi:hypothetical protein
MLRGNFAMACKKLDNLMAGGELPAEYKFGCTLHADRVLCLAKLGLFEQAIRAKELLDVIGLESLSADDLLLVTESLLHAKELLGPLATSWRLPEIDGLRRQHRDTSEAVVIALATLRQIPESFG